ncbi:MAG: gephyrin-like molybdotransferase Glp [Bryobacteraceae bacterium]
MAQPELKQAIDFMVARQIVIKMVRSLSLRPSAEEVPIGVSRGRILAEPVAADRDYPALDRSLRDGFAVRSDDLPGLLNVRGELRAGDLTDDAPLTSGDAIEIMTGAPVPSGADAIVMVEHVERIASGAGARIRLDARLEPGQWISRRGSEALMGTVLIPAGERLDSSHVATLAMVGYTSIKVSRRPSVAILATGDELVGLGELPAPHQIRNSNSYALAALVESSGASPTILPIARDTVGALRTLLAQGLEHDVLLVSGGVSAGKYDLVKPALRELGVSFQFEKVRIQPGQPTAFGMANNKPVFGLPGNPGSSMVTYRLFAEPAIQLLAGEAEPTLPLLLARFSEPFRHKAGLTRFLPARLEPDGISVRHIPWQGSSDVPALAKANAFLIADHDRESWGVGDLIRVIPKL